MWTQIEIDNKRYLLDADQDIGEMKSAIVSAAAHAPMFVTLRGIERTIDVLVQSTTRMVISRMHRVSTEPEDDDPAFPYNDWEM